MASRERELIETWEERGSREGGQLLLSRNLAATRWMPSFRFSQWLEREEDSRRFALTAVAIKRFELKHGRWPDRLDELDGVGVRASDRRTVSGGPFGYEVADDSAYLWSYRHYKEDAVAATRATIDADDEDAVEEGVLIRIR